MRSAKNASLIRHRARTVGACQNLGRHGTERAIQECAREGAQHPSYSEPWRSGLCTSSSVLGALAFRAAYAIGNSLEPWRSEFLTSSGGSCEPWRSKLCTPPTRLNMWVPPPGALGSRGVETVSVTGAYWGGSLGVKAASVTVQLWDLGARTTVRTEPWRLDVTL